MAEAIPPQILERPVVDFYKEHAPYHISVDVGAGSGFHTERLAELSDKVYAIEPLPYNIERLRESSPSNVEIVPKAIWTHRERIELNVSPDRYGYEVGGPYGDRPNKIQVNALPLDQAVSEENIDFIKIDTEGCEVEVLQSAGSLLDSNPPMVVELHWHPNLKWYHDWIKNYLKDYDCWMAELGKKLSDVGTPIPEKEGPDKYHRNNHRLLCECKG